MDKELRKYQREQWWNSHKDKIIAYTIMTGMIVFFVVYLIIAFANGWDIRFN